MTLVTNIIKLIWITQLTQDYETALDEAADSEYESDLHDPGDSDYQTDLDDPADSDYKSVTHRILTLF